MATLSHTPYNGNTDTERTNLYISDGHGLPIHERTNRYISDGHGGQTLCRGHTCPADPILATAYMETVRRNYERQHSPNPKTSKQTVTHEQIYVSFPEDELPSPEERMEIMRLLIERTELRHFPGLYVPHDNEPNKHGHISLCPYSIDGSRKLCLNNTLLYDLRRELDYICVERGYSIIESPELWGDAAYKQWFFQVKTAGHVKLHPPKDRPMDHFKRDRKQANSFATSKAAAAAKELQSKELYKKLTRGYTPENTHMYYTCPYLFDPYQPNRQLHIRRAGKDGSRESGELELQGISLSIWADGCLTKAKDRNIHLSGSSKRQLATIASNAKEAAGLMRELDIRTHEELIGHIKETGQDIAELKQDIKRQETILASMSPLMAQIQLWETTDDTAVYSYLKSHRCGTAEEIADVKKRHARALAHKDANEALLKQRSAEYRKLKRAETALSPACCQEVLAEIMKKMLTKEVAARIGYVDDKQLQRELHKLGALAGLPRAEIDGYIERAYETARKTTLIDYRYFMRMTYLAEKEQVSDIYNNIRDTYADIRALRQLENSVAVIGPITLVLSILLIVLIEAEIDAKQQEIELLRWEAEITKGYAREDRYRQQKALGDAKARYDIAVQNASQDEIHEAKNVFLQEAFSIIDRVDLYVEVVSGRKPELSTTIANADARRQKAQTGKTTHTLSKGHDRSGR